MNSMQTCNSVTKFRHVLFHEKTHFLILAGSVFCQKMIKAVNRGAVNIYGKIHFLLISEIEFFHKIKVTELRDGITSLRGIHE